MALNIFLVLLFAAFLCLGALFLVKAKLEPAALGLCLTVLVAALARLGVLQESPIDTVDPRGIPHFFQVVSVKEIPHFLKIVIGDTLSGSQSDQFPEGFLCVFTHGSKPPMIDIGSSPAPAP